MLKIDYDSPSERFMYEHGVSVEAILAQREHIQNFAARSEQERLAHSRAQIVRMKQRFASKAIDYSKMRWDQRRGKFVEDSIHVRTPAPVITAPLRMNRRVSPPVMGASTGAGDHDWSRLTKDTAEATAKLNGVWKPEYEKLRGTGRIVMTVGNLLRSKAKRGEEIKWL